MWPLRLVGSCRLLDRVGTHHSATPQLGRVMLWDYWRLGATGGVASLFRHRISGNAARRGAAAFISCVVTCYFISCVMVRPLMWIYSQKLFCLPWAVWSICILYFHNCFCEYQTCGMEQGPSGETYPAYNRFRRFISVFLFNIIPLCWLRKCRNWMPSITVRVYYLL